MRLINLITNRPVYLKNKELGKRIFILANGPSLNDLDLSLLKSEVIIGMNGSTMLEEKFDFESQYYVVSDKRFLLSPIKRKWATDKLSKNTRRVIRADLRDVDDPESEDRTTYVNAISRDGFSKNLSNGFFYGNTTTMLAIQLAWHLGSSEVYILGCDLRYMKDKPRFYEEENPQLEDAFTSIQLKNIIDASIIFEESGRLMFNCSSRSFLRPYLPFIEFNKIFDKKIK